MAQSMGSNTVIFHEQEVVTLAIPAKMRLVAERSRIPVRIFKKYRTGRYKLIRQWAFLTGSYEHGDLNAAWKWTKLPCLA